ncbi:MAG: Inosose dehydratase [Chloroflexi bacterium ADurb.Bin325]|nr:MAG: Inosose dehydratase [Chloroflexi bacterium ADurb.Bin325]
MTTSRLAAQLYTVREFTQTPQDLAATLKKVRAIGYTAVQVSGIGPISHADVKAMLDDAGLACCITHIAHDRLWNDLPDVIEQHHLWNCRHVAIGSMPPAYRKEGEAGYRRFAQEASRVGQTLSQAGLTFSYHNHSFEFVRFGQQTALELLYAEADPRYLQAELDTYWVQHGGGDPVAWIRKLAGRMPVIHLKDMVMVEGGQDTWSGVTQAMAEIGEGNLNWPAILAACEEAGVEWYAVEQDVCRRDPFESLRISYNNLRAMGLA